MYFPLSQITTNLTTQGGEFKVQSTGEDYVGNYFKTSKNQFYTGKAPNDGVNQLLIEFASINQTNQEDVEAGLGGREAEEHDEAPVHPGACEPHHCRHVLHRRLRVDHDNRKPIGGGGRKHPLPSGLPMLLSTPRHQRAPPADYMCRPWGFHRAARSIHVQRQRLRLLR